MSQTLSRTEEPGDADLIAAVRGGDADAYGELFSRHVNAARRLGRQLAPPGDADDLVSEAFAKVLGVLRDGGGPDLSFRAYLLSAVRRLHVDRCRALRHVKVVDDLTPYDAGVAFRDTALEGFESGTAARAFASLPERWQLVLWHTEVEGQRPAEVAPLLGMSPNSVAALAYRAREGLRQAFVSMHAQPGDDRPACEWTRAHLGPYLRHGLARRDTRRLDEHLRGCRACTAVALELGEENARLSALVGPAVLGGAAAAYAGTTGAALGGAAAGTGLGVLVGRLRDLLLAHAPVTAAVGVTAGAVVVGGTFVALQPPAKRPASGAEAVDAGVTSRAAGAGDVLRRVAPTPPDEARVAPSVRAGRPTGRPAATPAAGDRAASGDDATAGGGRPSQAAGRGRSPGARPSTGPRPGATTPDRAGVAGPGPARLPGRVDLTVSGSAGPAGAGSVRVVVRVSGLPDGGGATLRIGTGADLALGDACSATSTGAVCSLTGGGSTTVTLVADELPQGTSWLGLAVRPTGGAVDTHPADNVARVALAG